MLKLPVERLYVSVYEDDDEAEKIWHEKIGVPMDHIFRMGKEDNFWEAGTDGPCGPCSEIYFDRGEEYGCGKPGCTIGCDCDRYMEFWNLVFTQFERHEDGTYTPLAQKNIDTGMGLERLAAMMQGVDSIFDVDTVKAIRDHICSIAGCTYGEVYKKDVSVRVITDHIRAVTFLASDGVLPSNEGAGYVMRRLVRRAVRHGKLLGIEGMFLKDLVKTVVDCNKCEYNELEEKYDYIVKVLTNEELNFNRTIDRGMKLLDEYIEKLSAEGKTVLDGEDCFKLSDTHGFPIDLTREILEEKGMTVDEEGYYKCMEVQRTTAREARGGSKYMGSDETVFHRIDKEFTSEFLGYETLDTESVIDYIANDDELIMRADEGQTAYIVSAATPFYAESGGQVGDTGVIVSKTGKAVVADTQKAVGGKIAHTVKITEGYIEAGQTAHFKVDAERRMAIARNHSAAHLLQAALREVLGDHVHQKGQLVDADRVRFDFSHFEAITIDELNRIEQLVNEKIMANLEINTQVLPIEEAQKLGAMALFGEKYGETVRVVSMGDFSMEFCGGVHVTNTAQIGMFKIISESSTGAGVRRIEAVTGHGAVAHVNEMEAMVKGLAASLKCRVTDVPARLTALQGELKAVEQKAAELADKIAKAQVSDVDSQIRDIKGIKALVQQVSVDDIEALRNLGDQMRDKVGGVVVLASVFADGKISILTMATKDAVAKGIHAGNIVKEVARICGGGGGGRPDMAQAGGKDASKLGEALEAAWGVIETQVK